jgi:FtsZ-binding cell division protein ZapB
MKYKMLFPITLSVLFLTLLVLTGCGVPQADYDELLAQKTSLETEKLALQSQADNLETENNTLESEKSTLETEKQILQDSFDQLNDQYDTLEAAKQSLQDQYDALNEELANIESVYPPRDFTSRTELENWLAQNTISERPDSTTAEDWISNGLALQDDALADGYIINMDYDYNSDAETYMVYCTAVIDGFIWFWDPEADDINMDETLMALE